MWTRIGKRCFPGGTFLSLLLGLLVFTVTEAQELHSSVDRNPVSPGERFKYHIVMKGGKGRISPPDFSKFPQAYGPSKSTEVRMVNGNVSRKIKISYTVKAPPKEGTFKIGQAKAKVGNKVIRASAIRVKVKKGGGQQKGATASSAQRNKSLMARIRLNKNSVYKGEAVRVSYLLFSRYRNLKLSQKPSFPPIEGAWTEEVEGEGSGWKGLTRIDGKRYRKALLRRLLIHPQKTGSIKIKPMKTTCRVNRSFFRKGKKIKVTSNSPTLTIKKPPKGAPEEFNGAVGNFELKADMNRDTVKTNGSVKLRIKVQGSGNLQLIQEPDPKIPPDLEQYEPNVDLKTEVGPSSVRGTKEWKYLMVPRQSGDYSIGPIRFSYFNPSKERYQTLQKGPFELRVTEEKAHGTQVPKSSHRKTKEQVDVLEEKLRYIRTDLDDLTRRSSERGGSLQAITPFLPPFLGFLFFLIMNRWRRKEGAEKQARKTARARLRDAEKALKKGERQAFHEELYKGLLSYLSDRTGIETAELSKERIGERMQKMGIPEELVSRTLDTVRDSEMLRYAPSQSRSDEAVHEETIKLLAELETYLK
ncbi:MAG: BatD family protein [Flavobacteriales bacterium]